MSRATGPKCRLCRRAGEKLYLKGDKCASAKCPVNKRPFPPGQHGKAPIRISEYNLRLREKQKAKQIYSLSERQFKNYFAEADNTKGVTGSNLFSFLERRLDNVVFRLNFAQSRNEARQLVRHGHVKVNGKKVNIPSFRVKKDDLITAEEKALPRVKKTLEASRESKVPGWVSLDSGKAEGKVVRLPSRDEIDTLISEQLIVEFYSR